MPSEPVVSDTARLREDFALYCERAREEFDAAEAVRWHGCAKRAQEMVITSMALQSEESPSDIAEMMALMSGDPVTVLRRLVASFGLAAVTDSVAELVGEAGEAGD